MPTAAASDFAEVEPALPQRICRTPVARTDEELMIARSTPQGSGARFPGCRHEWNAGNTPCHWSIRPRRVVRNQAQSECRSSDVHLARIFRSLLPSKATLCANADSGLRAQRISGLSTKPLGGFVFSPHCPTTIANQNALSEANPHGKHAEREKCGLGTSCLHFCPPRPSTHRLRREALSPA